MLTDAREMLHVLVDLRPRLLADAVALALHGPDRIVDVAGGEVDELLEATYDLVVVEESARAPRPGRYTSASTRPRRPTSGRSRH